MDQKKVGRFIAECRKEKGLTQAQLAEQFGISNRAVSNWETGKSLPDASIMIDLSNYLGITVNELLSGGRIDMEDYKDIAEQTIVDVQKGKEKLKKKYSVIIIAIVLAILILCYFALKFLLVDKVISNLGNLNNGFIDAEEIDFVIKDQENPIEDNGIVFDNKYSFKKESDDSIKSYVSEDKKIKLYVYKPINYVTLENEQWQDIIYSNGFVSKFLLGNNAFVKYTTKNRITSYPELLLDTYIHSGPISHSLIFSLLPNYRQEIVRGTLKYSLVDDRADRFYYAELEDYIVTIETYDNERVYSFTAYDRNSQQEFFVTLENDTYSLSKEEIFEFFESVSLVADSGTLAYRGMVDDEEIYHIINLDAGEYYCFSSNENECYKYSFDQGNMNDKIQLYAGGACDKSLRFKNANDSSILVINDTVGAESSAERIDVVEALNAREGKKIVDLSKVES